MLIDRNSIWIVGFAIIVVICNLHLFTGTDPTILLFDTTRVVKGEWWRIITHPFVHVSWYHLLLDCGAILLLFREMRLPSKLQKLLAAAICAAASLVFSLFASSQIHKYGLCGFSGTAHGLTLLLGIMWLAEATRCLGSHRLLIIFCAVVFIFASLGKSLIEVFSGTVIFSDLHFGELGIPIVESHFGGVIGGLAAALILWALKHKPFDLTSKLSDNTNKGTTTSSGETVLDIFARPVRK